MTNQPHSTVRGLVVAVLLLISFGVATPRRANAYSGTGSTFTPSGSKGCFAQVLGGGAYNIIDVTWNSGDTGAFYMFGATPSFSSGDEVAWFDQWRNRLATSSRSLYLFSPVSGTTSCYRLPYDSRTWVAQPWGSANFRYSSANTPTYSGYGTCVNA